MSTATNLQALRQPAEQNLPQVSAGFFNLQSFELIQRVSNAFAKSDLVPKNYQGNLPNCMIAMDMAQRMGANPLMVMQNLYIVHGTPGWSSKFLIATINVCGRFTALRYEWKGEPGKPDYGCRAWAIEKGTNERLDGIWVTWEMVHAEGWSNKNGSKWKTMPDQMFVYRAAAFWQRAYAPELGMGLQTAEELGDVYDAQQDKAGNYTVNVAELKQQPKEVAPVAEAVDTSTGEITRNDQPALGLNDAIAAARNGDIETAQDISRELNERDRAEVEKHIQQAAPVEQQQYAPRQRVARNIE